MAKRNARSAKQKKGNGSVRRTVLGTLSGVLMASAVIVAAIPAGRSEAVEDTVNVDTQFHYATYQSHPDMTEGGWIPDYTDSTPVYFTSNGLMGFAYVNRSATMEGVLAYYDADNTGATANLVVPDAIDAFQYDGTTLTAVADNGRFLCYIQTPAEELLDVSGNSLGFSPEVVVKATGSNMNEWSGQQLYLFDNTASQPTANGQSPNRGAAADQLSIDVRYIGSRAYDLNINEATNTVEIHLSNAYVSGDEDFLPYTDAPQYRGVFEGANNFSSVTIPDHILAIGDRAFLGCQVRSVSIANALHSIGDSAFENCRQLSTVTLANDTMLEEIGNRAFCGCASLASVNMPNQVVRIGAGCFMNCTSLSSVNLYGYTEQNGNTSLTTIGDGCFFNCYNLAQIYLPNFVSNMDEAQYVFYDCSGLRYLSLSVNAQDSNPDNDVIPSNNFTGCSGLLQVTVPNRTTHFNCDCPTHATIPKQGDGEDCAFGYKNLGIHTPFPDDFRPDDHFVIMTYRTTADKKSAYTYACEHGYSVGYLDPGYEGQYERVSGNYFYCVNENNELIRFSVYNDSADTSVVDIPENIGNFYIETIGNTTFQGNDDIHYVFIPGTVRSIADNAFKNCVNLEEVEFGNAANVEAIGADAFKSNATDDSITLRFIGQIGSDVIPYQYAMTPGNNFNSPSLPTKYIAYTSAFPSNLQIELNVEKDDLTGEIKGSVPTLVSIPTYDDLSGGNYSLSYYDVRKDEQNAIAQSAYVKYRSATVSGNSITYSEAEQAVIDAVFRPIIPEGVKAITDSVFANNDSITSVVLSTVEEVPAGAFKDCDSLSTFVMRSSPEGNEVIGDRAFEDCDQLSTVILPATLGEMGSVPFIECDRLESVDFSGSPVFTCEDALIKQDNGDGTKTLIECLKPRGNTVASGKIKADELSDVSELRSNAFQFCDGVTQVYMQDSTIDEIPDECFAECTRLNYAELSDSTMSIGNHAFRNTALSDIVIPSSVSLIAEDAFTVTDDGTPEGVDSMMTGLNVQCENPSTAYSFATRYGFTTETFHRPGTFTVSFFDMNDNLISTVTAQEGESVTPPAAPSVAGYTFLRWSPNDYQNVSGNCNIYARYQPAGAVSDNTVYHRVVFWNYDGSMKISTQNVAHGTAATTPATIPEREGYTFIGWIPEYDNVIEDMDIYPQYRRGSSSSSDSDNSGNNGGTSDNNGNSNNGNSNNGNSNNGNSNNGNSNNGTSNNGSAITTPTGATTGSEPAAIARPEGAKASTGTSTGSSSSTKKNTTTKTGTTVAVTKNGISNPDLVSATVNGSSDDFVVKISDSESAKNAVEAALLGEYGTLTDVRYFAMDISLYDKTGTSKIQNTDGISVTITMPIPDALQSYAGNNKAGAVSGAGALEKLNTKFTTINGVPCMSFVCTHFSPYTVYVDLNNLSSSMINDVTPTTGDPIHPKWFLSIGLALMSVITFFLKGSKKKVVKVIG